MAFWLYTPLFKKSPRTLAPRVAQRLSAAEDLRRLVTAKYNAMTPLKSFDGNSSCFCSFCYSSAKGCFIVVLYILRMNSHPDPFSLWFFSHSLSLKSTVAIPNKNLGCFYVIPSKCFPTHYWSALAI